MSTRILAAIIRTRGQRETKIPACTTAGEKTYICTICGRKLKRNRSMRWATTGANGSSPKPATTSAAGEETPATASWDESHTETLDIPKLTPAPSGGKGSSSGEAAVRRRLPSPSAAAATPCMFRLASVSGSTAGGQGDQERRAEQDRHGTAPWSSTSPARMGVTGVTLSTDTIDSICKTEADGVTVKLPSAELRVDRQTLAAVTEQAAGSKIRLVVEPDGKAGAP